MNVYLDGFGTASIGVRVKYYDSKSNLLADVPGENTIGVAESFAGWRITDRIPETPDLNVLYMMTCGSGPFTVNIARKANLHLMGARLNGVAIDAWIYQSGAWHQFGTQWDGYWFRDGDQYIDITGGWKKSSTGGTTTIGTTLVVQSAGGSGITPVAASVSTDAEVDLTNVNTVNYDSPNGKGGKAYGAYLRIMKGATVARQASIVSAGQGSIDVSDLTGSYKLQLYTMGGGNGDGYGDIRAIWRA